MSVNIDLKKVNKVSRINDMNNANLIWLDDGRIVRSSLFNSTNCERLFNDVWLVSSFNFVFVWWIKSDNWDGLTLLLIFYIIEIKSINKNNKKFIYIFLFGWFVLKSWYLSNKFLNK
jgi:hypothetical protein